MNSLSESLPEIMDGQLAVWPLARRNYQALGSTERRALTLGDMTVGIQHNPARIVSTGAKTDPKSLSERPCFLCKSNRPAEQAGVPIAEGWELLLNPFPIFPTHYTIVSTRHQPQEGLPLAMVEMAEKLPGHTVFFNGKRAGASCPDHLHCQAVMTHELPLMRLAEERHALDNVGNRVMTSSELGLDVPFSFTSVIVTPDDEGMRILASLEDIVGKEYVDKGSLNFFVWIDRDGLLRMVSVPRGAHRPSCYGSDAPDRHLISPGCIDMAGVIIAPRREDYDSLSASDIRAIYSECGI